MQTRRMSLFETVTNTVIGLVISYVSNHFIFATLGIAVTVHQNLIMVGFFTAISIVRGYVLRRMFNTIAAKRTEIDEHAGVHGV